jgi:hypothetical protein
MCRTRKERIAFCAQEEGMRGEIFAISPIALRSRYNRIHSDRAFPPRRKNSLLIPSSMYSPEVNFYGSPPIEVVGRGIV